MASREFTDSRGRRWLVWEVHPTLAERRRGLPDWRLPPRSERRRAAVGARTTVEPRYATGWLVCEARGQRRRVAPIPPGWAEASNAELEAICERGTPVRPPRRLIE